jgi:hypothetical protein
MADNRGNLRGSGILGGARTIKGTADFVKLSKVLKEAGNKTLRNELHKMVREPAKVVIPKIREAARGVPGKGGIGAHYGKKPLRTQTRTGEKTAGVRVVMPKTDPRVDQEGRVAHPVFGRVGKAKNKGKNVVVQKVPAIKGFFSDTLQADAPQIRDGFLRALDDFTDRIVREAK